MSGLPNADKRHRGPGEAPDGNVALEETGAPHSMATRILGWAFVAVFAVELLSPIAVDSLRITGFVFLLSGIMVLVGSESAIRFTISRWG